MSCFGWPSRSGFSCSGSPTRLISCGDDTRSMFMLFPLFAVGLDRKSCRPFCSAELHCQPRRPHHQHPNEIWQPQGKVYVVDVIDVDHPHHPLAYRHPMIRHVEVEGCSDAPQRQAQGGRQKDDSGDQEGFGKHGTSVYALPHLILRSGQYGFTMAGSSVMVCKAGAPNTDFAPAG